MSYHLNLHLLTYKTKAKAGSPSEFSGAVGGASGGSTGGDTSGGIGICASLLTTSLGRALAPASPADRLRAVALMKADTTSVRTA